MKALLGMLLLLSIWGQVYAQGDSSTMPPRREDPRSFSCTGQDGGQFEVQLYSDICQYCMKHSSDSDPVPYPPEFSYAEVYDLMNGTVSYLSSSEFAVEWNYCRRVEMIFVDFQMNRVLRCTEGIMPPPPQP